MHGSSSKTLIETKKRSMSYLKMKSQIWTAVSLLDVKVTKE